MKNTNINLLQELLKASVNKLYEEENPLPNRGGMEQACVARIFYYMQVLLYEDQKYKEFSRLNLDNEYNKNLDGQKETENLPNGSRPDIILHERKTKEKNTFVIEFKMYPNYRRSEKEKDIKKLKNYTDPNAKPKYRYLYKLGAFVMITHDKKDVVYEYFREGKEYQFGKGINLK